MHTSYFWRALLALLVLLVLWSTPAQAARLEIDPTAHGVFKFGAAMILYAHILGGAVGLVSGVIASLSKKGSGVHRKSGRIFFAAMFFCYLIGGLVAPFLPDGQRPNFVAAVLALYLLITGIEAARNRSYTVSYINIVGLGVALCVAVMGATFLYMGYHSDSGTVDGSPPESFVIFIFAGAMAFVGEVRVIIKRTLSNADRVARHLWRMCFSFFIASGSLFFGQPQLFPEWFNASILPSLLSLFPILALVCWWVKVRWKEIKKLTNSRVSQYSTL